MAMFRALLFTIVIIANYFSTECNGINLTEPNKTISRLRRASDCGTLQFQCDNGFCVPDKELCACGKIISEGTSLIIDGENVNKGSSPWHVTVYRKKKSDPSINYICGGSIISANVVLSAAHCFTSSDLGQLEDTKEYYIAAGKSYNAYDHPKDLLAQKSKVKDIIIPTNYRGGATNYQSDIAIIVLEIPFTITLVVQPVCVDWQNKFEDAQLKTPNNGIVFGWGSTTGDQNSRELRQLVVPYISQADCFDIMPKSFHPFLTPDKFCAGYTNGTQLCKGDAGGGLVFYASDSDQYYIRGLVSLAPVKNGGCAKPTAYTRISAFMDTIKETVSANRNSNL